MSIRESQVAKIISATITGTGVRVSQLAKFISVSLSGGKVRVTQIAKVVATNKISKVRLTQIGKIVAQPHPSSVRLTQIAKIISMPNIVRGVRVSQLAKIISTPLQLFTGVRVTQMAKIISLPVEEVLDPLLKYYLSLMTSQYQNSPKILTWLRVVVRTMVDMIEFAKGAYGSFDLSTAAGAQLDILGAIVGANRRLPFQPSGGVSPILDDETYRLLLISKVAQNQWNGSLANLYSLWAQLFPGGIIAVQDNQNMTATIFLAGSFNSLIQDMIINGLIIPRPEGVLYNYTFATLPIFGFDQDNLFVAGFDKGHFA